MVKAIDSKSIKTSSFVTQMRANFPECTPVAKGLVLGTRYRRFDSDHSDCGITQVVKGAGCGPAIHGFESRMPPQFLMYFSL